MLFYSKRSCALPTLKNALRLQKQRQTCEMIPLARTTVSTWVAPRAMKAPLRKVKCQTRSLRLVAFFFFYLRTFRRTCVHVRKECLLEISGDI